MLPDEVLTGPFTDVGSIILVFCDVCVTVCIVVTLLPETIKKMQIIK